MTAVNPDAWGECKCGKRYRRSNIGTECGGCRNRRTNQARSMASHRRMAQTKLEAQQEDGLSFADAMVAAHTGVLTARRLEHTVEAMLEDVDPGGWIGSCKQCHGYVVVDLAESDDAYGSATRVKCPGVVPWAAAERRLAAFDQHGLSPIQQEADRDPMYLNGHEASAGPGQGQISTHRTDPKWWSIKEGQLLR